MVNVQGPWLSFVEGMKLALELLWPQLDHILQEGSRIAVENLVEEEYRV